MVITVNIFIYFLIHDSSHPNLCPLQNRQRVPGSRTAPASQNITNSIPREKPDDWPPCLLHKLKHGNSAKDGLVSNQTINDKNNSSCFLTDESYQLQSNDAIYSRLKIGFKPPVLSTTEWTQYHVAARRKGKLWEGKNGDRRGIELSADLVCCVADPHRASGYCPADRERLPRGHTTL